MVIFHSILGWPRQSPIDQPATSQLRDLRDGSRLWGLGGISVEIWKSAWPNFANIPRTYPMANLCKFTGKNDDRHFLNEQIWVSRKCSNKLTVSFVKHWNSALQIPVAVAALNLWLSVEMPLVTAVQAWVGRKLEELWKITIFNRSIIKLNGQFSTKKY